MTPEELGELVTSVDTLLRAVRRRARLRRWRQLIETREGDWARTYLIRRLTRWRGARVHS